MRKIQVDDVRMGMYIAALDRPWLGTPFLFQGFWVESQVELKQLRDCCEFVFVDEARSQLPPAPSSHASVAAADPPVGAEARSPAPVQPPSPLQMRVAREARHSAEAFLERMMGDIRLGDSIRTEAARQVVVQLVESVSTSTAAALWLTSLKRQDEYTSIHSLNVCVLSIVFAHHLGLPRERIETIGLGALLHDVGKMRTPREILNKPGRLTEDEFQVVRRHPVDGYQIIRDSGQVPDPALEIIRYHHERVDGRGYPEGLEGEAIGQHVLITAIADVYDALTSDRVYHRAIPPHHALRILHRMAGNAFGQGLVEEFIRCIGIYPIGSLVRLHDGSLAVVLTIDPKRRLKPVVMLVRDAAGRALLPRPVVNLALMAEQAGAEWAVAEVADPAEYGVDLAQVVQEESLRR